MGSLGQAVLDLISDASKMDAGLDAAKGKVEGALGGLQGTFGSATGTMMGVLSAGALQNLGRGIISFGKDTLGAATEAQNAQAQLNAVLESTGGIAGVSAEAANSYADSLSQVTAFDDEAILGGESMLLTFTNIGQDVFPTATQTMLDMSQALGQDLGSSAMQLGKALNDPINGVTALRRVGVQFTDDQEAMIKSMVEGGDAAGAQSLILGELQKEFGGSAEAAGQTMAGQMAILGTATGNLKEDLGTALFPVLQQLVEIAQQLMPYLQQAVEWFTNLPTPVKEGLLAFVGLLAVLGPIITVISTISTVVGVLGPIFGVIAGVLGTVAAPVLAIIAAVALLYLAWKNNFLGIQETVQVWWDTLKEIFAAVVAFLKGDTAGATEHLRKAWDTMWTAVQARFEKAGEFLKNIWTNIKEWFKNAFEAWKTTVHNFWSGLGTWLSTKWHEIWTSIVTYLQTKIDDAVAKVKDLIEKIKGTFDIDWLALGKKIIDGIIQGLKDGIKAVTDMARSVALAALAAVKDALGIPHSPSLAFTLVGQSSMEGIVEGLKGGQSVLRATMGNIAASMTSPMQGVGANIGSFGSVSNSTQNRPQTYSVVVNNPLPERASTSVDRELRKLAYLGGAA